MIRRDMIGENEKQQEKLKAMRHSAEHVLTQAMLRLYPGLKMAMGPATADGFYFDFEYEETINEEDFPKIEKEMQKIIDQNLPFSREELKVEEARKLFPDNPYKQEWLDDIEERGEKAIVYWAGKEFVDLCAGPHVASTGEIGAFRLLSVAGAYWRGDEKSKMLTRIYGTAFETQEELDNHLKMLEEAKERDHRKIGKELNLFSFHPAAPGDIFWHPKGLTIINELIKYWREIHEREGYVEVRTPEILTRKIWDQSGHTSFFIEKIYKVTTPDSDKWNMAVRPMNCDGSILIYKSQPRSYREFPLRMGELGVVHRYESSGELHGIIRPREFTQDDAHIYCTPDQVKDELKKVMELCFEVYETFGLEPDRLELSTRPEKSIGSDEVWERAKRMMREVLKEQKLPHQINEGEGAFYGPKFDFHLKDSLGRTWQCSTIQLDFAQPENFDLEYVTEKGTKERPVMIHRVLYGSIERFLGILIENCGGDFPIWLAPVQAVIIPVSKKQNNYAKQVVEKIVAAGPWPAQPKGLATPQRQGYEGQAGEQLQQSTNLQIRLELDDSDETLEKKIRNAQLEKIPYMLVVGSREERVGDEVSLRLSSGEDLGATKIKEFKERIREKIKNKSLTL